MLNNQRTHSSPIVGLVFEASRGNTVAAVLTDLMQPSGRRRTAGERAQKMQGS